MSTLFPEIRTPMGASSLFDTVVRFASLEADWSPDFAAAGGVATGSARRCETFLPQPRGRWALLLGMPARQVNSKAIRQVRQRVALRQAAFPVAFGPTRECASLPGISQRCGARCRCLSRAAS